MTGKHKTITFFFFPREGKRLTYHIIHAFMKMQWEMKMEGFIYQTGNLTTGQYSSATGHDLKKITAN